MSMGNTYSTGIQYTHTGLAYGSIIMLIFGVAAHVRRWQRNRGRTNYFDDQWMLVDDD